MEIDENTKEFLRKDVGAVDALEILLFLHEHPGIDFSPEKIFQQVQTSQSAVNARLEMLHTKGLISKSGARHSPIYRAELNDPERTQMIARLSRLYTHRRVSVIEALYAPSGSALDQFRAAFQLKRK